MARIKSIPATEATHIKKPADPIAKVASLQSSSIDPALDFLFSSSSGPVTKPSLETVKRLRQSVNAPKESVEDSSYSESLGSLEEKSSSHDTQHKGKLSKTLHFKNKDHTNLAPNKLGAPEKTRKRKRGTKDDIEGSYMRKLAREESKENALRKLEQEHESLSVQIEKSNHPIASGSEESTQIDSASNASASDVPRHEAIESNKEADELEKASRTVFLANVSTTAITSKTARKALKTHLSSFLPSLNASKPLDASSTHNLNSIRFRSTAYSSTVIPRRAAFARQELMDTTTSSTNAYAVYSTVIAAREACKVLNGTIVLGRHLRVDGVAHPAKIDPKRCVFVGNLGFVDKESPLQNENDEKPPRRPRAPGDVEEGLWRQFGKSGTVESVRVIRDSKTRIGKGFAYVQFEDGNAVEAALLFNEKKFPPLLPRKLRVSRAKTIPKRDSESRRPFSNGTSLQNEMGDAKTFSKSRSLQGRASKLFGQAGAAKVSKGFQQNGKPNKAIRQPESFVFEGYRASSVDKKQAKKGKDGKSKNHHGKPQNRSSKRAVAWKESGGKKTAKA